MKTPPPDRAGRDPSESRGGTAREQARAGRELAEFLAQTHTVGRGRVAQAAAEAHLIREGYRIVGRNWTCASGEIDLIAFEGDVLCIIEVKARSNPEFGPAVAAVGRAKQRRIVRVASLLIAQSAYRGACRFDVLGLDRGEVGWDVTLIRGAFEA